VSISWRFVVIVYWLAGRHAGEAGVVVRKWQREST